MKKTFWRISYLGFFFIAVASHATSMWNFSSSFLNTHLRSTVGGTVSGLVGTLVLQNKEVALILGTDGSFTFQNTEPRGDTYNVTVLTQPPAQTCTVANGAGKVINGNVTNIAVHCTTNPEH